MQKFSLENVRLVGECNTQLDKRYQIHYICIVDYESTYTTSIPCSLVCFARLNNSSPRPGRLPTILLSSHYGHHYDCSSIHHVEQWNVGYVAYAVCGDSTYRVAQKSKPLSRI